MFYAFIFLILILFSFLDTTSIENVYKRIFLIMTIFILFIVSGLRYETGGDWTSYTKFFKEVEPIGDVLFGNAPVYSESYMEPAYKMLNSIIKFVGGNIQVVFFIVAIFNGILLFKALTKYVVYPIIGLMVYYCSMYFFLDMVAIRQAVAVMLFFCSVKYIVERQFWRYCLLLVIAFLFHRSVILLLPLYFFAGKQFSVKRYIIVFTLSILVFFLQLKWMTGLLTSAAKIVGGTNGEIIKMYVESTSLSANRSLSVGVIINILLFAVYLIKRNELSKYKYFNIFFNLFVVNLIVFFVFYEFIEISNRYRYYFLISNIALLPYLISIYKEQLLRTVAFVLICGFCFLYGRSYFLELPGAIAFNPYQNYLNHLLFDTKSTGNKRLDNSDQQYIENNERE